MLVMESLAYRMVPSLSNTRRNPSRACEGVGVWRCEGVKVYVEVWRCEGVRVWRYCMYSSISTLPKPSLEGKFQTCLLSLQVTVHRSLTSEIRLVEGVASSLIITLPPVREVHHCYRDYDNSLTPDIFQALWQNFRPK